MIIKIVGRLTNPRLEFINLHKFVTLLVYFVTTSATLTGVSMRERLREHANFIHALSTRTASRNSSNFQSHFYLFSVGFMKGGKESKELCSVFGLGLRLNGRFSRNFVYCFMCVYLRRVLAVAEKKSLQLPQY